MNTNGWYFDKRMLSILGFLSVQTISGVWYMATLAANTQAATESTERRVVAMEQRNATIEARVRANGNSISIMNQTIASLNAFGVQLDRIEAQIAPGSLPRSDERLRSLEAWRSRVENGGMGL